MPQQLEEPFDMTPSEQLHFSAAPEAQWRELFEYSPVMYFMVDPAGTVLAVNSFGAAQLGYSVSDLVGQSVLKLFFPDDKDAARKNLELCVQTVGQQNKWEIRKVRKDGTLLWVRENAKAVRRSAGDLIVLIACEDISDHKRGEQRLAAQSGVSRVLAESDSLAEASPHLLRTICEAMDWDWGALWSADQEAGRLRCDSIWHASTISVSEFDAVSQRSACAPGEGRAGQVWKTCQSLWIADVAKDPGFRRGPAAARCGLHTGLACPILLGQEALGIVEFFSRRIRERDEQELATLSAIGSQIGQFIRRKRAEQAVQTSEKRFRALIEHAYDIVLLLSAEGTILYASPSVERVLGYAPDELIGRNGAELIHPDHRQASVDRFARAVEQPGAVITGERLLLRKDGSSRWVENVIVNLLLEPSVQAVVVRQRDVTERKQAEAAQRESEQRFRTLIQFSFDVYWESDAQHRFTRQEFAENLADGPTPGSDIGIGKTRWELPYLEPDEEAWRKHRETLDAHLPFRDFELARPRPDGGKRYWSVSGLPVFDQTGRFVGYRGLGRHVTDRKETELALRESEQRFRDYAEIASDWFWESDSEHRFTTFTHSARGWGFVGDFIGVRRWELAADREEEPEKWRAHIATLEAHEPFRGLRYRAARPDGVTMYLSVSGKPVFDANGTFLGYRGVATDVSAEVRGEQAERTLRQALQRSEAYLAEAQTITHTGSWAYDVAKRRMTYSSEEHHRLFGFDPAAGMPDAGDWARRIHPDDRETVTQAMEQTIHDRRDYELEHRVVHADGAIKFIHTVGHPVFSPSGDLVEIVGTSTDITDRKREEYLTEQVSERIPDLVSIIGRDCRYRRANPTYERVWRIPAAKVVGMHVGDVVGREKFDRAIKPNLDRCFAGEEVRFAEWFDNPGGRRYWVVTYSPLKLESERVDAALAVARDLTEQTLAAEKLRDARIQLAHVNRVVTIGQLTASIAHEVNQPIGALVTNSYAASRMLRARPPDLSQAREALDDIIKDGRRVSDVIQRIRAMVKKAPAQVDLLDINEVIVETSALARSEILRNDVSLETHLGRDLPPIRGDRVQLQQVIMNLVMNAVEAMSSADEGKRELQIATDKDRDASISITVSDSGPVLEPESLDRFFEAFYSTKPTGMGIGLSICRSIIEAHEGRIWATANAPRGATIHITLPVSGKTAPL